MYVALKTIILEDTLGRDNQFLKGHKYDLTYSYWTIETQTGGRGVQVFHFHKLLSEEDIKKYFKYEEPQFIYGGRGVNWSK